MLRDACAWATEKPDAHSASRPIKLLVPVTEMFMRCSNDGIRTTTMAREDEAIEIACSGRHE